MTENTDKRLKKILKSFRKRSEGGVACFLEGRC